LGYVDNSTAYKILDITNNKIIISRNDEFFEFTPGYSHLSHCDNDISNFMSNNIIRRNDNTYFYDNTYDINHGKDFNNTNNKMKDIGNVDYIIKIKFIKHKNGYFLHQHRYIDELLSKFNMKNCTPFRIMTPIENEDLRKVKVDETKYRSIIWNLLYLSICTRPDIIFSVSKAARRAKEPNMEDWNNLMRILRYLKGTKKFEINFKNNPNVKAYVDSDYGGDLETRRSTTGFLITFGGAPTNWCSKIQKSI